MPKAVARIAFGTAIQKLLVSASRTTSSPRAIANQPNEKPCQTVVALVVALKASTTTTMIGRNRKA